ncbi:hypothetical protein KI387_002652, partial [Taxus chinensis]
MYTLLRNAFAVPSTGLIMEDENDFWDTMRWLKLYCDVEESYCKSWNKARQDQGEPTYSDKIFDDLVRRFEKPDRRNRWDSPLFEFKPAEEQTQESSSAMLEAISFLTKKIDSKSRDVRLLQPTIATQSVRSSESNSLYELDRATQTCSLATRVAGYDTPTARAH